MDQEQTGFLAGFLTMAGIYAITYGIIDARRAYKIKRKSYGSVEELDGERVTGPFSYWAKRNRKEMYIMNPNSLERI